MTKNGNGSDNDNDNDDYKVGYGKPPEATRFKKGQSGNPRGPKKGSRGLKTELSEVLDQSLSIKISGKIVKGKPLGLALHTLALRASSGNMQATKQLIDTTLQVFGTGDRGGEKAGLSKQDQELLDRLLERGVPEEEPPAKMDGDAEADDDGENGNG